ncbi:BTAD domain-containing putative transcriptional regulator [Streptomyces aurantiacus]|uniref:AfsR/SARP family transcriptional regulator n=1 Tax=Streptomyces aurantiacus TaxID=47760 RepID=UPI00055E3A01|nr:BTAD domain-containing putative transcriptional regulator [Streptomyces aurantiacus]
MRALSFGILGPIEVWRDGVPVNVGPALQRRVLAALLVDANRLVSAHALVDRAWGTAEPRSGRRALYGYISRLRRALEGHDVSLTREEGSGYRLRVGPEAVDLHRFRHLLDRGRAAPADEEAEALFQAALGSWRGEAFAGADTPWFNTQRDVLDGERFAAELDLTDVRLRLAKHALVLTELSGRAEAHPLDERVAGHLMLALYRCGRQAAALECYERLRRDLAREMGIDPGAPLRRLHQQILAADPALHPAPATPAVVRPPRPARPVPRQLPPWPATFVGRGRELAALDVLLKEPAEGSGRPTIFAVGGTGGVGKSWLALHWAHQHLDRFPDGQLYAALCGFDPAGEPVPPDRVLRGFLDALGTPLQEIPTGAEAQAGLYRSLVARRRMLILLDNARDADQVRPLLPGSATCLVLVTSRSHLGGLTATHGSPHLTLDTLPDTEAREVLTCALGQDRVAAEPAAVTALLRRCAGLPLALGIVAARAAAHPGFPLAELAGELDDASGRLDALTVGDLATDLRAVFETSYRALDAPSARAFALLGPAPGADIGPRAAARLIGTPLARTRAVLRTLEAAHLVQQHAPGRYRMHNLVRLYATERCQDRHGDDRDAASDRLVDFYAHTAYAADRLLSPQRTPIAPGPSAATDAPSFLSDAPTSMAWFEAEHPCLLAAHRFALEHGRHGQAWRLAWALDTYHWRRGLLPDRMALLRATLAALDAAGAQPATRALAHRLLGRTLVALGRHDDALGQLRRALALFAEAGDAAGTAQTHLNLALAREQQGDDGRALTHAVQNLRIRETLDSPPREAEALNAVGWYHARLGHHEEGRAFCERSLTLCRRHHFLEGEAFTLDSLGYIAHRSGRYAEALDHYHQALALRRELGDAYEEADALACLGDVYHALGRTAEARRARTQALALYRDQDRGSEAERTQALLGALGHAPAR